MVSYEGEACPVTAQDFVTGLKYADDKNPKPCTWFKTL